MRILMINSEYPPIGGGAGNATENLARCLTGMGHQVRVLTAHYGSLPFLEQHGDVSVYRILAARRRADRSNAFEQLAFIAAASGRAPGLVRQFRPEVVLAFFGMPSGAAAWLLKASFRIPYVVSLRGGDVPGFRPYDFRTYHKLIGPLLRLIWHAASAVVANSNGLRDLARAFEPSIAVPVVPNGVDLARYVPGVRAWSPVRLMSVGRLVYQKGLDLGLRSLADLKDLHWEWIIVGDGPQVDALRALSGELGLEERIRFTGWLSHDQLLEWYHQANMFLFPSRHEGMPNAVLEAMASGLPVIATRIAGNEELVAHGETGILVNPEDVDGLRIGLRRLMTDESARRRMGEASRRRVEDHYSWDRAARQYEALLLDAAHSSRSNLR
jgi:glycosyltransferase involved in cell wall biosynthesis